MNLQELGVTFKGKYEKYEFTSIIYIFSIEESRYVTRSHYPPYVLFYPNLFA
jgi:hypothetical protein